MHRRRIGRHQRVELSEAVEEIAPLETRGQLARLGVHIRDLANIPVVDLLVVVVLDLHHLVARREGLAEALDLALAGRVQGRLELDVDLLEEMRGDATLLVRRSKTDGEGRGEIAWLAPDTVVLVRKWLEGSGISDGRLFRSVAKGGRIGERLHPGQVARISKAMAREAVLPDAVVEGLSGHSARVGAAQDMIAAGIELPAILQAGRWKSTAMVNRYGERLLAQRSGAAQLARLQQRENY